MKTLMQLALVGFITLGSVASARDGKHKTKSKHQCQTGCNKSECKKGCADGKKECAKMHCGR
jgi:hypothetical protein